MNLVDLLTLGACSLLANGPRTDETIQQAIIDAFKIWLEAGRQPSPKDIEKFKDSHPQTQ